MEAFQMITLCTPSPVDHPTHLRIWCAEIDGRILKMQRKNSLDPTDAC